MKTCQLCNKEQALYNGGFYFGATMEAAKLDGRVFCLSCVRSMFLRYKLKSVVILILPLIVGTLLLTLLISLIDPVPEILQNIFGLGWLALLIYVLVRIARLGKLRPDTTGPILDNRAIALYRAGCNDGNAIETRFWTRAEYRKAQKASEQASEQAVEQAVEPVKPASPAKARIDTFQLAAGIVVAAIFGYLTLMQLAKFNEESEWILFWIGFIPVPVVLLSGAAATGGLVLVARQVSPWLKGLFRR